MPAPLLAATAVIAAAAATAGTAAAALQPSPAASPEGSIAIKGERHTATHFLTATLDLNAANTNAICPSTDGPNDQCSACVTCGMGCDKAPHADLYCCWKHGYATDGCAADSYSPPAAEILTIVRSPYPWLLSMHDEPYDYRNNATGTQTPPASFSDFLRAPFVTTRPVPSAASAADDTHATPMALWVAKVRSYLSLSSTKHVRFRHYPDLFKADAMAKKLAAVGRATGYAFGDTFSFPLVDTGANDKFDWTFSRAAFDEAARYEEQLEWLAHWTQADLDYANSQLPDELFEQTGLERQTTTTRRAAEGEGAAAVVAFKGGGLSERERRLLTLLDQPGWEDVAGELRGGAAKAVQRKEQHRDTAWRAVSG